VYGGCRDSGGGEDACYKCGANEGDKEIVREGGNSWFELLEEVRGLRQFGEIGEMGRWGKGGVEVTNQKAKRSRRDVKKIVLILNVILAEKL
jgi:hypothetical protein